MNELQLKYKRETGNASTLTGIESELMTNPLYGRVLSDFTKKEILSFIENDTDFSCIKIEDIPSEFLVYKNLILPDPKYIEWLEEQVNELNS